MGFISVLLVSGGGHMKPGGDDSDYNFSTSSKKPILGHYRVSIFYYDKLCAHKVKIHLDMISLETI